MAQTPFLPATGPLGHDAPLDYAAQFPLLGVPLEVRSNSPAALAAAERAFGPWRALAPELIEPGAPRRLSIVVHPAAPVAAAAPFVYRAHSGCLVAAAGPNLLTAWLDQGVALAVVTPELVDDEARFRADALERLALLLTSRRDRAPLTAGAVVRQGRALALVGPGVEDRAALCYACLRAGFQLLATDVLYVSLERGLRLWGAPWRLRLDAAARQRFPELADLPVQRGADDAPAAVLEVAALGGDRVRPHADRGLVCLVQRQPGVSSALEPVDPALALAALSADRADWFDLCPAAEAAAAALTAGGAYRLSLGSDLTGAAALLHSLIDGLAINPPPPPRGGRSQTDATTPRPRRG